MNDNLAQAQRVRDLFPSNRGWSAFKAKLRNAARRHRRIRKTGVMGFRRPFLHRNRTFHNRSFCELNLRQMIGANSLLAERNHSPPETKAGH